MERHLLPRAVVGILNKISLVSELIKLLYVYEQRQVDYRPILYESITHTLLVQHESRNVSPTLYSTKEMAFMTRSSIHCE